MKPWVPSLPLAVLERYFKFRPDYQPLWQRICTDAADFTAPETAQLILIESSIYAAKGDYGLALQLCNQALELGNVCDSPSVVADAWASIAWIQVLLGRYADCNDAGRTSLAAERNGFAAVGAWIAMAMAAVYTNQFDEGQHCFDQALRLSRQLNFEHGTARVLMNQAQLHRDRGEFELYLSSTYESAQIFQKYAGQIWWYVSVKVQTAVIRGQRTIAHEALAEYDGMEPQGLRIDSFLDELRGQLATQEEDYEAAERYLQRALTAVNQIGEQYIAFSVRTAYCRLRRLQGDAAAAVNWGNTAVALARRAGSYTQEAEAHTELARAHWALGDMDTAEAELLTTLDIAVPLGAAYWAALATFLLAALHQEQHRLSAEAMWIEAARRIHKGGYEFIYERERDLAFPMLAQFARSHTPNARHGAEQALVQLGKVPPAPLHVTGLGKFEVRQGRRRIAERDWQQRRSGELFRFLLLQPGHAALREAIAEALSPDQSAQAAHSFLHKATSTLRHILEPDLPDKFPSRYVTVEADQIALHLPAGSTVDFEEFERGMRAAAERSLNMQAIPAETVALYAGDLFLADRYADWTANTRERLAELHRRGLLALAEQHLAGGRPDAALDASRQILASDPWHEDAVLAGMKAWLALNNRPAALSLYRTLEHALYADLEVTPRKDLRELAESIRKD